MGCHEGLGSLRNRKFGGDQSRLSMVATTGQFRLEVVTNAYRAQ